MPIRLPPTAGQALRHNGSQPYRRLATVPPRTPPAPPRAVASRAPHAADALAPTAKARVEAPAAPDQAEAACAPADPAAPPLWRQVLATLGRVVTWPLLAVANLGGALGAGLSWVWQQILDEDEDEEEDDVGGMPLVWRRPRSFAELHLSAANETPGEKADNRAQYVAAMGRRGTWGSELELHVLAERAQVRAQVWDLEAGRGGEAYVCCATVGAQHAARVVNLKLVRAHYSALLGTDGDGRCAPGTRRASTDFRRITIPANGDCQFLAFAYAADLPHARRLLDSVNDDGREPEGTLRADAALLRYFELDAAQLSDDRAVAEAALAELVVRQRRELVAELSEPTYEDKIDTLVVQELAEAAR